MEFSILTLIANLPNEKLIAPRALEKKLGCQDEASLRKFYITLEALEKIGLLVKERGRYRRVQESNVVEAKLRCSSKGFCFAIQDEEDAEDIYIRECHLSTAWNGDRVLVKILKEGSRRRRPEGEVRLIVERANPSVLARVKESESGEYSAVPLDDRLLFEIDLQPDGINLQEAVDHIVDVQVKRYPLGSHPPVGKLAQVLGRDAEAASDIDIVSCKHDLPKAFFKSLLEAASNIKGSVRQSEIKKRLDLRNLLTFSFSHEDLKTKGGTHLPIEHAFTLDKIDEERWRLGIHVTDVAHYIEPDSDLDKEAKRRGISVHLGNTVIPMLPDALTPICTLTPGGDRLAYSLLLIIDSDAEILEYEIQPSAIQVDRTLTFSQTQQVFDGNYQDEDLPPNVRENLNQFLDLSQTLKSQRWQRGAFELQLEEGFNHYNDEGPLGVTNITSDAQSMVCEFVLLANQAIAEHLQKLGVPGIYRVQHPPDLEEVQELIQLGSHQGIDLYLEDEENVHPQDYQRFLIQFRSSPGERILTYQLESSLKPAVYTTHPGLHFGIAAESGYTHFTSPCQRYCDLLVQRLLDTVFRLGRNRRSTRSKEQVNLHHSSCHGQINWNVLPPDIHNQFETELASVVANLSEREQLAQEAERDLIGLQKTAVVKEKIGETFQGLITGVQSYGFFVEITLDETNEDVPLRLEGLVHVNSLKDDWYEYRSRQQTLVGRKNRRQFRLGDNVVVQVKSVDYYRQQIDLVVVGGGSEATNGYDDGYGYDDDDDNYTSYRGEEE